MTFATVKDVAFRGLASAVPAVTSPLSLENERFGADVISKISISTGIVDRRIAPSELKASDLCVAAAQCLLAELKWEPDSVELLIFITQTPDFDAPSTACTIQDRLGLPKTAAAFDISLGCSGYAYGLWVAGSLLRSLNAGRALVLVGDTLTHRISRDERALWPLFGDAGSATALEIDPNSPVMYFELGTDGSGFKHLLLERSTFSDQGPPMLHMDGLEVFSFALREVPPMVRRLLDRANLEVEDIDQWVFHQANEFILHNLQKRLKIPAERFTVDLAQWGNTSGASIPLAISSSLRSAFGEKEQRILLAGFGIGLSWSSVILEVPRNVVLPSIVEVTSAGDSHA